ncbi:MAG: ABC transporter ATP-binding protein [Eubacteriales bacterium]|jgi:ATP-binding cassette subfamily B multidrug efflux pump|nr:ABC transporter ATP-binding protein [Eubacteriales bacterium]
MNDKKEKSNFPDKNIGRGPGYLRGTGEKPKDFKATGKRLLNYIKPHNMTLIIVFFLAILSTIFTIISPKIMGLATTKIFEGFLNKKDTLASGGIDFSYVGNIVLILTAIYLFGSLFTYVMQYTLAGLSQKIVYKIREEMSEKLSRLPISFFDKNSQGDILSRVVNDVDNIGNTLQQSLSQLVTSIVSIIGVLTMMLIISPLLSIAAFITIPLSIWGTQFIVTRSQKYYKQQQKSLGDLNGHIEEMYTGHKIIKVFQYEKKSLEKFDSLNEELYQSGWKAQFLSGIIMPLMGFINNLGYVFVAVLGAIRISQGLIAIGDVQAIIQYTRQLSHPIIQAASISNIVQSTLASSERIFEFLDELEEEVEVNKLEPCNDCKGKIEFKNVFFAYDEENYVIKDFSLNVKSGQTVAIVGATGSGKTTIVNLLMKFYEINKGSIIIDNLDIKDLKRNDVRSIFGMVLQDTWLFKGSIYDNIHYGNLEATEEEVYKAAKMANLDTFVHCLPEKYMTEINEDGTNISRGQKQLITIARAFISNPSVLILDEATSNVDTRTEKLIQKATQRLMKGRTNFIIAHRISTIKEADLIILMDEGQIIEKGTHEELLDLKGLYYDLYRSQFTQ